MKVREQFLKEYQDQVLDSLVLPPCLSAQYMVLSCLKDGERQVYLIQDRAGWPAVLKIQSMGRDVKPQNVILDPSGRCHLIDLGAARHHRPEQQGDTVFLGTRITAPPEQFGYQQTDQRSDLYSLGILMRFLLTGIFDSSTQDIGPGYLRRIIRRCTAFDPRNRYSCVQSVYRALKYHWLRQIAAAVLSVTCMAIIPGLFRGSVSKVQPQSSLLEDALRQELQLDDGEPIPTDWLKEVEQLLVCGQTLIGTLQEHEDQISWNHDRYTTEITCGDISDDDLKLLAQCTSLRVLVLDYQQITDLSPLTNLPLEYLSLTGNQISNLNPLSAMTKLQVLDLGENPVRSVEELDELTALQQVPLEATDITSVDVFEGSSIQSLNVRDTWITNFSPLESCPRLTRLVVGELPGGSAKTLTGLTNLTELRLYSTPEVNLSYLPNMPTMTDVDLRNNPLTDLTPLLDCPWLTLLTLSKQHQPLVQDQLPQAVFQIQYQ